MEPWNRRSIVAAALLLPLMTMHGCGAWERASLVVVYDAQSEPGQAQRDAASRKRIERAFNAFSQRHGYKCRPHIKRVEEVRCRGPKDLHLLFQPSMNKTQFVAQFSWVDTSDRSHEEFMQHVSRFKSELSSVAAVTDVRFER